MSYHRIDGLGDEPPPPSVWPMAVGFPTGYQDFWSSQAAVTFLTVLGVRGWPRRRLGEGQLRLGSAEGTMSWDDGGPEVILTLSTVAYEWSGQGFFVLALCEGHEDEWRVMRVPPQLITSYRGNPNLYVVAMPNHEAPTAAVWAKYVADPAVPVPGGLTPTGPITAKNPHPWIKGGFPGVVTPEQPGPGPEAPPFGRRGMSTQAKVLMGCAGVAACLLLVHVARKSAREHATALARRAPDGLSGGSPPRGRGRQAPLGWERDTVDVESWPETMTVAR